MNAPLTPEQQDAAYLARLGERVRAWRTEQAMTRRTLSEASGVSERYLAQLESGQGNMSVLLLRKVARAMGVAVERLVADEERPARAGRIALVGLRGAGKSTLGRKLADSLGVPFIELDGEVEKEAGAKLGEVFAMYGQDAFRRFERRALERVLAEHPRAVIAAGGSLVTDTDTYAMLLQSCLCLWLKASPEEHMSRVIAQGDMRPFKGRSAALMEIRKLLKDREALYARADAAIETSGKSVKQSLEQMKRVLA
ncbi:MAG TPA: helix-turn-helix transcriptional regulator [Burkholderiales bacterium]|nr:helix-turn-helix transcriptional regulator [Burkholderiales bacterium]